MKRSRSTRPARGTPSPTLSCPIRRATRWTQTQVSPGPRPISATSRRTRPRTDDCRDRQLPLPGRIRGAREDEGAKIDRATEQAARGPLEQSPYRDHQRDEDHDGERYGVALFKASFGHLAFGGQPIFCNDRVYRQARPLNQFFQKIGRRLFKHEIRPGGDDKTCRKHGAHICPCVADRTHGEARNDPGHETK